MSASAFAAQLRYHSEAGLETACCRLYRRLIYAQKQPKLDFQQNLDYAISDLRIVLTKSGLL